MMFLLLKLYNHFTEYTHSIEIIVAMVKCNCKQIHYHENNEQTLFKLLSLQEGFFYISNYRCNGFLNNPLGIYTLLNIPRKIKQLICRVKTFKM